MHEEYWTIPTLLVFDLIINVHRCRNVGNQSKQSTERTVASGTQYNSIPTLI